MILNRFRNMAFASLLVITSLSLHLAFECVMPMKLMAQTTGKEQLEQGVNQYRMADFESAIQSLQAAIHAGLAEKEDIILAHKILASAYAAIGETDKAKLEYVKILEKYPVFDLLLSDAPHLRSIFSEAKDDLTEGDAQPPKVTFDPPKYATEKIAISLTAEVIDVSGVQSVMLNYKRSSQRNFVTRVMEEQPGNLYMFTIPAEEVTTDGIELYLVAVDNAGNAPAQVGSKKEPLFVQINPEDNYPPVISHKPILKSIEGEPLKITTTVLDNVGVSRVRIHYRESGLSMYTTRRLQLTDEDTYEILLTAPSKGLEYYLEAQDVSDNDPAFWKSARVPHIIEVEEAPEPEPEVIVERNPPWLLIGIGVIAVGGAAVALMGGGGDSGVAEDPDLPVPPTSP